jgi:hypothetical protein
LTGESQRREPRVRKRTMKFLKRAMKFLPALVCVIAVTAATAEAAEWYVTANGSDSGAGTQASPMSLTKALSGSTPARPGDTIWLRGGTYLNSYTSWLSGTASAPITIRAYPGERVVFDANNAAVRSSGFVLSIYGSNTTWWGFEIMSSDPARDFSDGPHNPNGVLVNESQNIKLINLIVHDLGGQGFGLWAENTGAEVYGCLIYNVGSNHWDHGIYVQNRTGAKKIADNIIANTASHGIHGYGSDAAYLDNITIEGNTVFEAGALGGSYERNILLGGGRVAQNPVIVNNYTYFKGTGGGNSNIGYSAGAANAVVKNNYWIGGNAAIRMIFSGGDVTGNFFSGSLDPGDTASRWPNNTFVPSRPTTGNAIFVRKNTYEPGRAHITIYNWARAASVAVGLAQAGLNVGDGYEIRDALNYFGAPVATGTYDGSSSISIPMNNLTAAAPRGNGLAAISHTAPQFGAFVLVRTTTGGGGTTPPPPPPPTTDMTPPTVSVTAPTAGATLTGTVTLTATAADDVGVAGVRFQVDGTSVATEDNSAPFSVSLNSASLATGTHTVTAVAWDARGNTSTSAGVTVSVSNAPAPPTNVRIVVEAESANQLRSPMVAGSQGETRYISTATGNAGYARFNVNIPKSGTYVIWGLVQSPNDASDSFYVTADSGTKDIYDTAEGKWSPSWQWTVVNGRGATGGPAAISPRKFTLTAGIHTIRFDGRDANTRLDRILITDDLAYVPQ